MFSYHPLTSSKWAAVAVLTYGCTGKPAKQSDTAFTNDTGGGSDSSYAAEEHEGDPLGDDDDGDGWTTAFGDCDDADASVNPDASEVTTDDIDNDCDGVVDETDEGGGGPYSSSVQPYLEAGVDFEYATEFIWPIGDGREYTHCKSDDGWYVYTEHQAYSGCATTGRSYCTSTVGSDCALHLGEDWNAEDGGDYGEAVAAIGAGEVVYAYNAGSGWGNVVIVWHVAPPGSEFELPDGTTANEAFSLSAHLATVAVGDGDVVEAGTPIGTVGDAGGTYSPHLHWEIGIDPSESYPGPGYSSADRGRTDPTEFVSLNATIAYTSSSITVTSPSEGDSFAIGDSITIEWTSEDVGDEVYIRIYNGPGGEGADSELVAPVEAPGENDRIVEDVVLSEDTFFADDQWYVCVDDGSTGGCSGHFSISDSASGGELSVGCGSDYSSLQDAVDAAEGGETIRVCAGSYSGQTVVDGKSIAITGAGESTTSLTNTSSTIFIVRDGAEVELSDVTIQGATCSGNGCGIYVSSASLVLNRVTVKDIEGYMSPGIRGTYATLNLNDVTIQDVSGSSSGSAGLGAFWSTVTATGLSIDTVTSAESGGAIYAEGSTLDLADLDIQSSMSGGYGGAMSFTDSTATVDGGHLLYNEALDGGALHANNNSSIELIGLDIQANEATTDRSGAALVQLIVDDDSTEVTFDSCDFGSGSDENTPLDVTVEVSYDEEYYDYTGTTSVTCDVVSGTCS